MRDKRVNSNLQLNRVFLYVEDMGKQVRFYKDLLGFPVVHPPASDHLSDEFFVVLDAGACKLVLHGGGRKRFGEDAPLLSFHTSDLRSSREALLLRGVKLGEIRSPAPGVLVSDGVDPEGNRFSIDEY
jgi:catechol 2,3-dioxygenase-like lactoylglutathione lyase family enzyme